MRLDENKDEMTKEEKDGLRRWVMNRIVVSIDAPQIAEKFKAEISNCVDYSIGVCDEFQEVAFLSGWCPRCQGEHRVEIQLPDKDGTPNHEMQTCGLCGGKMMGIIQKHNTAGE